MRFRILMTSEMSCTVVEYTKIIFVFSDELVTLWFSNLSFCIYPRSKRLCYVTAYSGCTLTPSPSTTSSLVMSVSSVVTPSLILNSATHMSISSSKAGMFFIVNSVHLLFIFAELVAEMI
ncbi:hypothetical protein PPL_10916 [Heterostelium album PN500]|uniref:Uncharacterized protein n=1 Tax=Heterostelium pallidum (strain ATCC 26659 / Pp 5 / PN500) TaxID=670386 RepID=D3BSE9_HETP5|nr:hypothetical protein PPL_10916 [Heterostelium album PN500]EFA75655.1 hypothetical protein PPL_10916 [Heterostelium album PN500]|eukprot:XP_020427789.1 hypothetical protein PPL_10916 [Heterostelium album PN500]